MTQCRSKSKSLFGWLFWTVLVFAGGFAVGNFSAPIEDLVEAHLGVRVEDHFREIGELRDRASSPADRGPSTRSGATLAAEPEPEPSREPVLTQREELIAMVERLGGYVRSIDSRIVEQQAALRENDLSARILRNRGEPEDSHVFTELERERERIQLAIDSLVATRDDALARDAEFQLILQAMTGVEETYVDDQGILLDTRAMLSRMERMGAGGGSR